MFENLKRNLYSDKLCGYAWDCDVSTGIFDVTVYMVVLQDDKYKFVKFRKIKKYSIEQFRKLVSNFNDYNVASLSFWNDIIIQKNTNSKSLVRKQNFNLFD